MSPVRSGAVIGAGIIAILGIWAGLQASSNVDRDRVQGTCWRMDR